MIVDLCGFPGSGKTTVQRFLMKRLAVQGMSVIPYRKLLGEQYIPKRSPKFLKSNEIRRFNYHLAKFRFHNPVLMQTVDEISRFEYQEYNLICEMFACYAAIIEQKDTDLCIVLDEGFVHRLAVIFRLYAFNHLNVQNNAKARADSLAEFAQIIDLVPPIDAAAFLNVSPEISRTRAFERIIKRRKNVSADEAQVLKRQFMARYPDLAPLQYQLELYETAFDVLTKKGVKTAIIEAEVSPVEASNRIFRGLESLKDSEPENGPEAIRKAKERLEKRSKIKAERKAKIRAKRLEKRKAKKISEAHGEKSSD